MDVFLPFSTVEVASIGEEISRVLPLMLSLQRLSPREGNTMQMKGIMHATSNLTPSMALNSLEKYAVRVHIHPWEKEAYTIKLLVPFHR